MAEKKKWIRDRGLIEIEGKEFPPMLSALVSGKEELFLNPILCSDRYSIKKDAG